MAPERTIPGQRTRDTMRQSTLTSLHTRVPPALLRYHCKTSTDVAKETNEGAGVWILQRLGQAIVRSGPIGGVKNYPGGSPSSTPAATSAPFFGIDRRSDVRSSLLCQALNTLELAHCPERSAVIFFQKTPSLKNNECGW